MKTAGHIAHENRYGALALLCLLFFLAPLPLVPQLPAGAFGDRILLVSVARDGALRITDPGGLRQPANLSVIEPLARRFRGSPPKPIRAVKTVPGLAVEIRSAGIDIGGGSTPTARLTDTLADLIGRDPGRPLLLLPRPDARWRDVVAVLEAVVELRSRGLRARLAFPAGSDHTNGRRGPVSSELAEPSDDPRARLGPMMDRQVALLADADALWERIGPVLAVLRRAGVPEVLLATGALPEGGAPPSATRPGEPPGSLRFSLAAQIDDGIALFADADASGPTMENIIPPPMRYTLRWERTEAPLGDARQAPPYDRSRPYRRATVLRAADAATGREPTASYGYAVGGDGALLVVGEPEASPGGIRGAGVVHVYERTAGGWEPRVQLTAEEVPAAANFGRLVAVSGERIAAMAGSPEPTVYVFERRGSTWRQSHVVIPLRQDNASLDLSGDRFAVGTPRHELGTVQIWVRDGAGWREEATLAPPPGLNIDEDDHVDFGAAIDIDGDRLLIGAPLISDIDLFAGAAFVAERRSGTWEVVAELRSPEPSKGQAFGNAVALDGDVLLVGGFEASDDRDMIGKAFVFERRDGEWGPTASLRPEPNDGVAAFGIAVAVDGDRLVVGASRTPRHQGIGAVYVFARRGGSWTQIAKLAPLDPQPKRWFGNRLTMVGPAVAVALARHSVESSRVEIFTPGGRP